MSTMATQVEHIKSSPEGGIDAPESIAVQGLASLKAQPGSHHHFSDAEVCRLLLQRPFGHEYILDKK